MYRYIVREQVIYGHFVEYLDVARQTAAFLKERGWAEPTLYVPVVGATNDVVYHTDYATLADFEREGNALMIDAEFMSLFRRQATNIVQGSSVSEIVSTIDELA